MTLTLDEVRKTKFHMARRTGYEVSEVDLFVDRVEASFAQLVEENQALKQQVEALKQAQTQARPRGDRQEPTTGEVRQREGDERKPESSKSPQGGGTGASVPTIVVTTASEASPAVVRLVQMATEQSETLVNEATAEANRTIEEANQRASQITTDARTKSERVESESRTTAERVTSEARANAQRVTSEAQARAADLDRQVGQRRTELFSGLEMERDQLQAAVGQLRAFEADYRQTVTSHLKQQLEAVDNISFEPNSKPALADGPGNDSAGGLDAQRGGSQASGKEEPKRSNGGSAQQGQRSAQTGTPRLDALLGEKPRKP